MTMNQEELKKWLEHTINDAEKQIEFHSKQVSFYSGVKHIAIVTLGNMTPELPKLGI